MKAALARRAAALCVQPLDYVCDQWVGRGGRFTDLALSLQLELNESCSRQLASAASHHLSFDAADRISAARRAGRAAAHNEASRRSISIDRAHRTIGASLILGITTAHAV